jgi:hypothetical protein
LIVTLIFATAAVIAYSAARSTQAASSAAPYVSAAPCGLRRQVPVETDVIDSCECRSTLLTNGSGTPEPGISVAAV